MKGYRFSKFIPSKSNEKGSFEDLLSVFLQLLVITSGDVSETLQWMNDLDKQHGITNDEYGMGGFIEDLKKKG